jgi:hypothetical protein
MGPTGPQGPSNGITGPAGPTGPPASFSAAGNLLDAGGPTTNYALLPVFDCGGITGTKDTSFVGTMLYSLFLDPWATENS